MKEDEEREAKWAQNNAQTQKSLRVIIFTQTKTMWVRRALAQQKRSWNNNENNFLIGSNKCC